jgi:hypothetical protein
MSFIERGERYRRETHREAMQSGRHLPGVGGGTEPDSEEAWIAEAVHAQWWC